MMKTYEFTLVLKNVDENTPNLEDSLYQAGCDDALINFRNGAVYLDFERQASSLEQAVMKAIIEVESSGAVVANIGPENLVTESDIAKRLNVNRQTVSLWTKEQRRKLFPKPSSKLSDRSPMWKWDEILLWGYEHGIIEDKSTINNAILLKLLNFALDERDPKIRKLHERLLNKVTNTPSKKNYSKSLDIKKSGKLAIKKRVKSKKTDNKLAF